MGGHLEECGSRSMSLRLPMRRHVDYAAIGKAGVVHRVGLDVATASEELDLDDDKIVDMLKIVSNAVCSMARIATSDDHVASCPIRYFHSYVTGQMEMAVCPPDKYLVRDVS